jgi:hypothetical protein
MNWLLLAQNAGDVGGLLAGFSLLWLFAAVLSIIGIVLCIWALVDAIQNPALDGTMRIVWVLVILFTNVLGAIIYLAIGRSTRTPRGA